MGWYKPGLWTRLDWIFCESGHGLQLKFCFGTGALGLYTQWSSEYTMPASKYTWKNSPWSGHLPAYAMRGLPAGHVTHVDLPVVYKNSINLIAMWSTLSLCFEKQAWQDSSGSDSFGEVTSVKHLITSFLVHCQTIEHTQRRSHTVIQCTTQHCKQSLLFFTQCVTTQHKLFHHFWFCLCVREHRSFQGPKNCTRKLLY